MNYEQEIISTIQSDASRMRALDAVKSLDLPDWLIAAGFVRNAVWDSVFGVKTQLNDIDVIYFCTLDNSEQRDVLLERKLFSLAPNLPWSVKNQARMHLKNRDEPYTSTLDAMSYWPEKQTSVGVKVNRYNEIELKSSFELSLLFNRSIDHNPFRSVEVFKRRIIGKGWLSKWPGLQVN
ncbi:nucleotidyltransferase family protein [Reinekea sp.]|jgi:hypothetical protein|uniref:nucleotidyltransferase family protein n=1 Tax=Reinekea sp. TaxID=1970455 RepID=UPI003988BDFF